MHIRVDDTVQILCGVDRYTTRESDKREGGGRKKKPTRARVLKVLANENKVIVEGVNRVYKHMQRSQKNPQGGRLSKEMPLQMSNVMLVCESCGKATRTGARFREDGSKERYCKKCGAGNGLIAPPRAGHGTK